MDNRDFLDDILAELTGELESEDSEFSQFVKSLIFNSIIKNLSPSGRSELFQLIQKDDREKIKNFLKKNIPNISKLLKENFDRELKFLNN